MPQQPIIFKCKTWTKNFLNLSFKRSQKYQRIFETKKTPWLKREGRRVGHCQTKHLELDYIHGCGWQFATYGTSLSYKYAHPHPAFLSLYISSFYFSLYSFCPFTCLAISFCYWFPDRTSIAIWINQLHKGRCVHQVHPKSQRNTFWLANQLNLLISFTFYLGQQQRIEKDKVRFWGWNKSKHERWSDVPPPGLHHETKKPSRSFTDEALVAKQLAIFHVFSYLVLKI